MRITAAVCFAVMVTPVYAENDVSTHVLDNGMEVVVIPDHRAPVVTHMVWYRVGAADEPAGKSGIAHYLEHLMFKGTDDIPEGEFSKIIAANGGQDNAFTSQDYTGYFQRIAADRLDLVMTMEADRMRDLIISDDIWQTERNVILEERKSRIDSNPASLMGEQRTAALYLNHPYGIPVIGWEHEIAALDREDAMEFYARFYAPNNAILIVAGDVTADEVLALANTHYGPIEPTPDLAERVRPSEPPALSPRRISYEDPRVRQPYVIRSYLAQERDAGNQGEAAALTVLAQLLGGGTTSVLTQKLEFEQGVSISAGAFYSGTSLDYGSFGVYAVPADDVSLEAVEAALDDAIAQFLEDGPDPAHLDRIRTQVRASEIFGLDSQESRARGYGVALTSGLTVEDVDAWPDALAAITAEDVMNAARNVFDIRKSVTAQLLAPTQEAAQ